MTITAGMLLLCSLKMVNPIEGFLKDVETKVWYINPSKDAFVEYNLKPHKMFNTTSVMEKHYDVVSVSDLESKRYMNCREINK